MSYGIPDLWPTRNMDAGDVLDSLVRGHDQEWTQLGRHLEAQSDIEARFNAGGAHLAPRRMSNRLRAPSTLRCGLIPSQRLK